MLKIPSDTVEPPLYIFEVDKVSVPEPLFIRAPVPRKIPVVLTDVFPDPVNVKFVPLPTIPPVSINVFAADPIVVLPLRLMDPLQVLIPEIFKRAPVVPLPLPVKLNALPTDNPTPCNCSCAPLDIVTNALVPRAELLWMFKIPELTSVAPE
jgi:hypothetical protein